MQNNAYSYLTRLSLVAVVSLGAGSSFGASIVYGNNATGGTDYIIGFDPGTGAITDEFQTQAGNGRGVVVVGNTLYYTLASSGSVYSYDLSTNTNNGPLFTIAGTTGLSAIAWDGTDFWVGDYSGTNQAYLYSPTGTLLNTIHLADCSGHCDGLEYFVQGGQGRLISNEGDEQDPGHYDIYDTSGNLLVHDFINTTFSATGIAFDGTNFLVSEIDNRAIATFSGTTGAFISQVALTGSNSFGTPLIEDLSANYAVTLGGVPEPGAFVLVATGLSGLLFLRKRRA
jgi:hypothetical protein